MKHYCRIVLLVLVTGVILGPVQRVIAQDILPVAWETAPGSGIPLENALRDVILGDTLADGSRNPNRVYLLEKGGFYWMNDRIDNSGFHLRIEGEEPDPTDALFGNPAVLQRVNNDENFVDDKLITGNGSLTLKNVYIIGCDDFGVQDAYQPMELSGTGQRFVFDNVIFQRSNFSIPAFTNPDNDIFFTNCVFRNLMGTSQQWEGRGTSIWIDQDTVIVENCTFFNIGFTPFQLEGGAANYVRFNHNTLVNIGRSMNAGSWWKEAYFTNNLIYNGFWHGEGAADLNDPNRDPDQIHAGIFSIDDLPSKYGPEEGRRIAFANNSAYRDAAFATYYADSIRAQPFVSSIARNEYINVYDGIIAQDTVWADPVLATTFDAAQLDSMIQNIRDIRNGITPATTYYWGIPEIQGQMSHTIPSWPLPEDFTYTNNTLLTYGSDGLPLGDLNWFPTDKETWEANKDQFIAQIEQLPGARVDYNVVETYQAEAGTLGGDAAVVPFEGFVYFQMDGGGYIEWTFELETEAQYDLNCWTHMRGNGMRGQRIIVNGVSIHDPKNWNEYIWDSADGPHAGMEINDWTWTLITQAEILEAGALTLPAGENTIRIEASWGWQHFAGWDIIDFATQTTVLELRGPQVTDYDIVTPQAAAAPWVPSGFNAVALNTTGTITWPMTAPAEGKYRLTVFYQNYDGAVTGQIQVDGVDVVAVDFENMADSTGLDLLSANFDLTAGAHDVTLTGTQANVDFVQLIQEVVTSVEGGELPVGFALEQNYPNPFNPMTHIRFSLGSTSDVKLIVFNVLGQKVATLVDTRMAAGTYTLLFDASRLASGLYVCRIEAGGYTAHRRMLLLK